jgi:rhodanese-related sulfurtransferase
MLESISVSELYNKSNIIDIRSIEKYNNNHIEGSINIPFEKLITNPSKYLKRNEIYYIYCQRGVQSRKTCQILKNQGFRVVNINGGYEAWILEQ